MKQAQRSVYPLILFCICSQNVMTKKKRNLKFEKSSVLCNGLQRVLALVTRVYSSR